MWRLSPEPMRDDLENIYMLLFRFVGNGFQLALCNVSWLVSREFVVLVPDPIVFAPWSVLLGRGELCDSCQDTAHAAVLCFCYPMTFHKSTGWATLATMTTARRATPSRCSTATTMAGPPRSARRAGPTNSGPDRC